MREAAMEQNENLKEAIANGDLSIGDEALARIERIYMPNVLRIESGELVPVRSHIDGAKYASFIDEAVVSTMQEVGERRGVAAEKVMEELKGINGKHMVERASVEFMSFVEDVYILLRKD